MSALSGQPNPLVYGVAAAGALLTATGLVFKVEQGGHSWPDAVLNGLSGCLFLTAGVLAHARRPDNRVGLLMAGVGVGLALEDVQLSTTPWVHSVGMLLARSSSAVLPHLVLAFPSGRLTSPFQRAVAVTAYATVFLLAPLQVLFDAPGDRLVPTPNLFLLADAPSVSQTLAAVVEWIGVAVAGCVVIVFGRRWVAASPPMRRVLAPVIIAILIGGAATVVGGLVRGYPVRNQFLWSYWFALCLLPFGFLAGVLRTHLGDGSVRTLVTQLGTRLPPARLRVALASALGDPSLQLGYWRPDVGAFVDDDGNVLVVPAAGSARDARLLERDGLPVALLVHDPALSEDRKVVDAVAAAAELALDNQRLADAVQAQLAEVRASRTRIVDATDATRRKIERDLHDGAQQRLVAATLHLRRLQHLIAGRVEQDAAGALAQAAEGLDAAAAELRALARGIHPVVLTDAGLVAAAEMLVASIPADIDLTATDVPRLPTVTEAAAYYVISEAVTNAMKHAQANRVEVGICYYDGALRVWVSDDGVGVGGAGGMAGAKVAGAKVGGPPEAGSGWAPTPAADRPVDPRHLGSGTGLLGLLDRVAAMDGTLIVHSQPGSGTTVTATLPAAPSRVTDDMTKGDHNGHAAAR